MKNNNFIKQYIDMDLYGILGLDSKCSRKELKKRYNELIKYFHPDKPTGDPQKCEQLNIAYMILSKDEYRNEYNNMRNIYRVQSKSHYELKQSYDNNIKVGDGRTFQEMEASLNKKHNFNPNDTHDISQEESNRRYHELMRERDTYQVSYEDIFKGKSFNPSHFNNHFNKTSKKKDNRIKSYDDVEATNTITNYCDLSIDNLYTDAGDNRIFGVNNAPINEAFNIMDINVDNNYNTHNLRSCNNNNLLEQRIQDYRMNTNMLDERTTNYYKDDCGKFGILDKMTRTHTNDKLQQLVENRMRFQ